MSPEVFIPEEKILNKSFRFALAGASSAWNDHAYHLFLALEKEGYDVTPLHPEETNICNVPTFPSLISIQPPVDVVIFTSPDEDLSMRYLREMRDTGLYRAWFEEGFWTREMEVFADSNHFEVIKDRGLLKLLQKGQMQE
jgi:predicted CoA-binding protein